MSRKLIIVLAIVLVIVIGVVIFFLIRKKDNNKDDKTVEITIKMTAGIPFKWVYEIEDENVVKFVKYYTLKDENKGAITGGHVYVNYVFEGVNPGTTKVTFKNVSIENEEDVMNTEEYTIKVDEEKTCH